jgi:serine/threonine protein kinase
LTQTALSQKPPKSTKKSVPFNRKKISRKRTYICGNSVRSITSTNIRENKAKITYDDDGDKKVNQYRVITLLGKGAFGKVKLVESEDDKLQYAMKI